MDIKFGSGRFYFSGNEGEHIPLGDGIPEVKFEFDEEVEATDLRETISFLSQGEIAFEAMCRISKELYMSMTGLRNEILSLCPNKKVVHLAKHATKRKIRNKNFNRAIRILEVK